MPGLFASVGFIYFSLTQMSIASMPLRLRVHEQMRKFLKAIVVDNGVFGISLT